VGYGVGIGFQFRITGLQNGCLFAQLFLGELKFMASIPYPAFWNLKLFSELWKIHNSLSA